MLEQLNKTQLQRLFKSCPVGILLLDKKGVISWVNDAVVGMIGMPAEDLQGLSVHNVPEDLKPLFESNATIHLSAGKRGNEQWLLSTSQPLDDGSGEVHYVTDVKELRNLAEEREQLKAELREKIEVDPITGLPNRRALFQSLEPQVSRSRRYHNPLSIIIMCLKGLDDIRAQHSDEIIQQLLVETSHMLNDQMRWADIIGRLDESEFLLVLPETTLEATHRLADKIRDNMTTLSLLEDGDIAAMVMPQFGIASWRKGDDVSMLMKRAREMLSQSD